MHTYLANVSFNICDKHYITIPTSSSSFSLGFVTKLKIGQQPLYLGKQKDSHINTSSTMQQNEHLTKGDDTFPQT
jgi:hypothetical protein